MRHSKTMRTRGPRKEPTTAYSRGSSAKDLQEQLNKRTRELTESRKELARSLEQQIAMAQVLGIISSSPSDLRPVLDAILANATRLCEGNFALLCRYDQGVLVGEATCNGTPEFTARFMGCKMHPGREGPTRLAALERRTVHVADITVEPGFSPIVLQHDRARTVLAVPLLRDADLAGVITIWRREVRPFTDQQIALVRTFAAQAVIAIENTRLLNELSQRTDDLSDALDQQTAMSEVLSVISTTTGTLQPVFDTLLANATRLCGARFGNLVLREDGAFRDAAIHNAPAAFLEASRKRSNILQPGPDAPLSRLIREKQAIQVADLSVVVTKEPPNSTLRQLLNLAGARTFVIVPMLKDDDLIGAIGIYRQEVSPFSNKQIELLTVFAKQAVIAIENARLLNELRQRTDDLSESLEQQTATSEVLRVI